jgi:hypothetical protein
MSSNSSVASVEGVVAGGASTAAIRALAVGTTDISAVVKWNAGTTGTTAAGFELIPGGVVTRETPRTCTVIVTN